MSEIFRQDHPVDGRILLTLDAGRDLVALSCRWPFDLSTDEWIEIENEYALDGYRAAVADVSSSGSGNVTGVLGGYLKISRTSSGFSLDFSNTGDGFMRKTLSLTFDQPVNSLDT